MRKSTKLLLGIGAVIATPVIINHVIAKKADERMDKKNKEGLLDEYDVYNWEYGDIRYKTAGEGKPLLLLHGLYPGASGMEWELVMEHLVKNHKVYVPDLLGFGYSSKPALDYCGYLFVRLIKDFTENVIGKPVIAVASLHTAAALASCAALNPEDFEKIVMVPPTGLETETPLAQDEDSLLKKVLESPILGTSFYNAVCSKKALTELYVEEGFMGEEFINDANLEKIYLAAHADRASGKYALAALFGKFFNTDIKETIAQLEMPYGIIVGDGLPKHDGLGIYTGIDNRYEIQIVEGAGLLPHTKNPKHFCDLFFA